MALSAPLLTRKRVIKVKVETTKGTKVAGDQALLVEDLEINPTADFVERSGTGLYLGHSVAGVVGSKTGECSFSAELRGNGSSGLEVGLAILLQACGFKQAAQVYSVHSAHADQKTISIDVYEDGVKKSLAGCSGNVVFEADTGGRMLCNFTFSGVWQAVVDAALPAYAPSTTAPMFLKNATFVHASQSIKLGKVSLDMACQVVKRADADAAEGVLYYMVANFLPTINLDLEADKVAGYDYYGVWGANTTAAISLALNDGTDKVTFTIPAAQAREITDGDRDGIAIYDWTGQLNHSSGNDCITITAAAA
jgi:hypothetical protein